MKLNNFLMITLMSVSVFSCKPGELITKSGYEYRIVTKGDGKAVKPNDFVFFTIKISGDDGTVLQEMGEGPQIPRIQIPAEHPTGKEANPVAELLSVSNVGDHVVLVMPIDSLPQVPPDIAAMKYIEYEIVIKDAQTEEEYQKYIEKEENERQERVTISQQRIPEIDELVKSTLSDFNSGKLEVVKTESGLQYYILKAGEGENVKSGGTVSVHYYGVLNDGTMFDNSFMNGDAFDVPVGMGRVIQGWDEGLTYFNQGSKGFLFIPSQMAYGAAGSPPVIEPNADLVFYIEIEKVKN